MLTLPKNYINPAANQQTTSSLKILGSFGAPTPAPVTPARPAATPVAAPVPAPTAPPAPAARNTTDPSIRDSFGNLVDNPYYSRLPATQSPTMSPSTGVDQEQLAAAQDVMKVTPFDEASRRKALMDAQQANLDALNRIYDQKANEERTLGEKYAGRYNAIAAMSGLGGTPDATSTLAKNDRATLDRVNLVNDERTLKIQAIYDKVDQNLIDEKKAALATNKENAKVLLEKVAQNATDTIKAFAQTAGVTFDEWKGLHQQELQDIIRQTGMSEQTINAMYNASADAMTRVDYKDGAVSKDPATGNAVIFQYGQNAKGKMSTRTIDTGIPYEQYGEGKYQHFERKDGSLWTFNPDTGVAKQIAGALAGAGGSVSSSIKAIGDAIISGKQPPVIKSLYGKTSELLGYLAEKGYDMTRAQQDWQATTTFIKTLNNPQQTRLRQAANTAYDSLDVIEKLSNEWDAGQFPALNKAQLIAAKQGALGKDAQVLATKLDAQITDVLAELAQVYSGGYSPTDDALENASKNLSSSWSKEQLKGAIELARTNLQIRINSIKQAGVQSLYGDNQYAPDTAGAAGEYPPGSTVTVDGKKYLVGEDGDSLSPLE